MPKTTPVPDFEITSEDLDLIIIAMETLRSVIKVKLSNATIPQAKRDAGIKIERDATAFLKRLSDHLESHLKKSDPDDF